ncbi:MAG TPA: tRNA pseudouridine(55) synthase TruB [Conexibacter sp.]|nr:tRNA pseudouridine(55) synthase TruB [Conexibacter sp.]
MDGVILFDKPAGVTSHDVVAQVRRRLGRATKVGHAGTLDPFATGLLLVLVGRATRAQRFLMALPKAYEAVARFGATSDTGDSDGRIEETGRVPEGELLLPTGVVRQRPPAYSAVRVDGVRAYRRARRGEEVELPEREVTVYAFEQVAHDGPRRTFAIRCSSGTYVRSLVADLGDAYCEQLRRTAIGAFDVADADPERIVPLVEALAFLPEVRLAGEDARRAGHGVAVPDPAGAAASGEGPVRLTDADGLIAIAEPRTGEDGGRLLKPVVGLRG